jgi:diaminopimelate epimerase
MRGGDSFAAKPRSISGIMHGGWHRRGNAPAETGMKFTKMHGAGNDYVYVNAFEEKLPEGELPRIARLVADRHTGVGGDGLILICPSTKGDFRMRMFNADGSEAEMCGNGIRCVGKYVYDHGMTARTDLDIETLGGTKRLRLFPGSDNRVKAVRVDMGEPEFRPEKIPVDARGEGAFGIVAETPEGKWTLHCLSMGNPHAVTFVEDTDSLDLPRIGPGLENHRLFPKRCNIEFARVVDRSTMVMRVWERGSGETLACGTGACATAVACIKLGLTEERVDVRLRGGTLNIEWHGRGPVLMTGPAVEVFSGEIKI